MAKFNFFILTGEPGVGKTTLTKKLSLLVNAKGVKTTGFYTEEIRRHSVREGFDVVTLDGHRGPLARDQGLLDCPIKFKVGKYGVLINEFEKVALPSLRKPEEQILHLLVIDEIGKMEFFSELFKSKIKEIFREDSNSVVLATIPAKKGHAIIESIRSNDRAKVWMVTKDNRNKVHEEILNEMKNTFNLN